jgi:hypothetical protein
MINTRAAAARRVNYRPRLELEQLCAAFARSSGGLLDRAATPWHRMSQAGITTAATSPAAESPRPLYQISPCPHSLVAAFTRNEQTTSEITAFAANELVVACKERCNVSA